MLSGGEDRTEVIWLEVLVDKISMVFVITRR